MKRKVKSLKEIIIFYVALFLSTMYWMVPICGVYGTFKIVNLICKKVEKRGMKE